MVSFPYLRLELADLLLGAGVRLADDGDDVHLKEQPLGQALGQASEELSGQASQGRTQTK